MHRRISARVAFLVLMSASVARAEPPSGSQGLGVTGGLEAGGGVTPGGLNLVGEHLYQVTKADWLSSSIAFVFGSGGEECFRSRSNDLSCDHGPFDGFSMEMAVAIRRYFSVRTTFEPFLQLGLGGRWVSFSDDSLRGAAVVLNGRAGVRAKVDSGVYVVAGTTLRAGFGLFGRGLEFEPQASLAVTGGVEFSLD